MAGIKLEGDWLKLERNLQRMARIDFTALHKEIGEEIVSSTQERFKTQKGPDGKAWKKSYRVEDKGGVTLRDTGRLRNSITCRARPDRVEVGTNDKRARIHQKGGIIKAKRAKALYFPVGGKWAVKQQVKMPARPYLGINDDDEEAIQEIIAERLRRCTE